MSKLAFIALFLTGFIVLEARAQDPSKIILDLNKIPTVTGFVFSDDGFKVATSAGAMQVDWAGKASPISKQRFGLTEMVSHPIKPNVLIASGYSSQTEKAGVIKSTDGGKTWARIDTSKTPAAFEAIAIDHANADRLYGLEDKSVMESLDGGKTWTNVSTLASHGFDLALSAKGLYAATLEGLMFSADGGKTWALMIEEPIPTTMVRITPDGRIFAFVFATGLITTMEDTKNWKVISTGFGQRPLVDFAMDPKNPARMLGVASTGAVMISQNGGQNWTSFEGHRLATPEIIKAGETLFNDNCVACHGEKGAGIADSAAPALDDSAHAWHHADADLMAAIRNGSDRDPANPMPAWKDTLSDPEIASLIGYMKSNWSFTSLACQGGRHMGCMGH